MRHLIVVSALAAGVSLGHAAEPSELVYVPKSTKKVCQLTGDRDRAAGVATLSLTEKRFGVFGFTVIAIFPIHG